MASYSINVKQDLAGSMERHILKTPLVRNNQYAHVFNVEVTNNGVPYPVGSVEANFVQSNGMTVPLDSTYCSSSGNVATVRLPQACYTVPGRAILVINCESDGGITCIAWFDCTVLNGSTENALDPGTIIPSVEALIDRIDDAVESIPADYSQLLASISSNFSTGTSYAAGAYVWYPGLTDNPGALYRFTSAHSGTWTGTDAVVVSIGNELNDTVRYTQQVHTDAEKAIARTNMGAAAAADLTALSNSVGTVPSGTTVENQIFSQGTQISTNASNIDALQRQVGTVPTGETVEGQITDLKSAIKDLNNVQSEDVTQDSTESTYYISSENILNVSTKWKSYFYIPKESDCKFSLKAYTNNLSYYNVGFYSSETLSNDAYISGLHLSKTDELDTIEFYKSDMPVGTKGILFCSRTDSGSGTEVKAYSSGIAEQVEENTDNISALLSKSTVDLRASAFRKTTNFIQSSGVLSNSSNWIAYWFRPSDVLSIKKVSTYTNTLTYLQIAFYNSEEPSNTTLIKGYQFESTTEKTTINDVDIPANTALILITNRETSGTDITVTGIVKDSNEQDDASVWAQYDGKFNLIAYSRVNNPHNYVINTAENYNYAGYVGYDGIKGDVRITSDNELVMCHDAGFTLDGNGEIIAFNSSNYTPIRNMTLAEVKSLVFAQKTDQDANMHVPAFEQYVQICKRWGKFCYPTLRDEYIDVILPKMFEILDKYDLRKHTVVNSMTYNTLTALREIDKEIPVTYTKDIRNASLTNTDIQNTILLGNSGFGFYAANGAGTTLAQLEAKIEASQSQIELAKNNGVRVYGAIATSAMYDLMLSSGFSGAHALDTWTD